MMIWCRAKKAGSEKNKSEKPEIRSFKIKTAITLIAGFIILGASTVLTACGTNSSKKDSSNQIVVFNYGDYIDRDLLDKFEKETGIEVLYEEFLTPEAMYTKYKNGSVKYDIICCSDYMLDKMIKAEEVQKIDYSKMKYIKNIGDTYWNLSKSFDPTLEYTVPYYWGTVGILYNTKMMNHVPDSWDDLWNPKYKNNIIMQNSVRDSFIPALVRHGYSINTTDENELRTALEDLKQQKEIVQSYLVDEVRDDMANDQAAMALIYSGEASLARDYNDALEYVVPKEGTDIWMDSLVIPKGAKNYDGAVKFLDFLCREDVAMKNFEYVYYSTPNEKVLAQIDDEEKAEDPAIFPDEDVIKRCDIFSYLGQDAEELYNRLWKELKAY